MPNLKVLEDGVRQFNPARGGKDRRYDMEGREVKNAILYTDAACAAESDKRTCLLDKRYVSHLGNWQDFARRVWPALIRERFDQADRLVVLSDGARWIRDLCAWLPMKTQMILDLVEARHRRGSIVITSNREPSEWLPMLADPLHAQALVDRFTNNAYDLIVEGESYRKRQKPRLSAPAN